MSLGTPAYMSPEQAAGESEFDGRTDSFSLGCVLYEMLAGQQPFTGSTAAAIIAKRFVETPARLRDIDGNIPVELEKIVARAMAREPKDRFATAEILHAALSAVAGPGMPVAGGCRPGSSHWLLIWGDPSDCASPHHYLPRLTSTPTRAGRGSRDTFSQ